MIRLCMLSLLACAGSAADDFTGVRVELFKGAERGASATAASVAGATGAALVLRWDEKHTDFHEAYLHPGRGLPGPCTLVARVRLTGGVQAWTLSARVRDAKGEMFDFNRPLPAAGADGWRELRIPVRQEAVSGHWGGNPGTGRLEGELTLAGLAANVSAAPATGELVVATIAVVADKPAGR